MPTEITISAQDPHIGEVCRLLAKIIIQLVSPPLKDSEQRAFYLAWPHDLGEFTQTALEKKYPWAYIKKMVDYHVECNMYWPCITYKELQELFPCDTLSDSGALNEICDQVLKENPKSITDFKKGKLNALNHLKGQVMRHSKGKADIQLVEEILKSKMT